MHEVIKQLAEKSGYDVSHTESQYNGHIMRNLLEKYARNIARECASLCSNEEEKLLILKHFGIE
jgi:hypothetical protein